MRLLPALLIATLLVSFLPPAGSTDGRRIDPASYLGGSGRESADAIDVGPDGSVYIAGSTDSPDFAGAGAGGVSDVFVLRMSADLKTTHWMWRLGGSEEDTPYDLVVAQDGSVIVVGLTRSANFPTSSGFYDTTTSNDGGFTGQSDGFALKLTQGGALVWTGYLGGDGFDYATAVDLDGAGRPTIVGSAGSCDFPTTSGAWRRVLLGCPTDFPQSDGFVLKLSADGSQLIASTLLGGTSYDHPNSVATSRSSGSVTVAGDTSSTDYPTTSGAFDRSISEDEFDGFVTKLDSSLSSIQLSTFLGGNDFERIHDLARDGSSNVYLTGLTLSTDFPTTAGAPHRSLHGPNVCHTSRETYEDPCSDAFATKLSADFGRLIHSTYLPAQIGDSGNAVALDAANRMFVGGGSDTFATSGGTSDMGNATIWVLSADGTRIEHLEIYAGSSWDEILDIDVAGDVAHVAGYTESSDLPRVNSGDTTKSGISDGFVARFAAPQAVGFTFDHAGGNEWWVEVRVTPGTTQVQAMDSGGDWRTLSLRSWGNWAESFHIEPGHAVRFRALDASGIYHTSCWFTHPAGVTETGGTTCTSDPVERAATFDHKGGNEWWVEVRVTDAAPSRVQAMDVNSEWKELTLRSWGNWAGSFHIEPGNSVKFRAMVEGEWRESCWFTHPAGVTPTGASTCSG